MSAVAGFSTRFISRHASSRPPTSPRRRPHPSCMSDSMFSIALPLARSPRPFRVIPGFGITLGFTLLYLSLLVLIPLRSEEHTSELQSLMRISYAVFCLKKKKKTTKRTKHKTDHNKQNHTTPKTEPYINIRQHTHIQRLK